MFRRSPRNACARAASACRRGRSSGAAAAIVAVAALTAACAGPALHVAADGPCYVDGRRIERTTLPFRYYGRTVVDALPADLPGDRADFGRAIGRTEVEITPPVTGWLFPFDLPLELARRLFAGPGDREVAAEPVPTPEVVVTGFPPEREPLRQRAAAARSSR